MNNIYTPKQDYKVLVSCMTYNQSKYIEDALNGFAMQQTDFPFVCLVIDDASSDGEQDVIKEWIRKECDMDNAEYSEIPESHIIMVRNKRNHNCIFAFYFLTKNLYGNPRKNEIITSWGKKCKYMAFCEGDDLWTSPNKLQEQHDTLENHPECTIAFHRTRFIDPDGNKIDATIPWIGHLTDNNIYTLDDYIHEEFWVNRWAFHTTSIFMQSHLYNEYLQLRKTLFKNHPYGDQPMMLTALFQGKAYVIQKEMSCYRTGSGGFFSALGNDAEKNYQNNLKLVKAYKDLDIYTGKKYHKWIRRRTIQFELQIYAYEDRIQWYCFNPEYWTIGIKPGIRTFFKCCKRSLLSLKKQHKDKAAEL